jgi:predicted transcriptional regulator
MKIEDLQQIQMINQQLDHMKELGLIEGYSVELGNSLETSNIKLSVSEEMVPLVFKTNDKRTIN